MDPIALQKQVRDNSEELAKYLGELKDWQEEIKQKEGTLDKSGKGSKDNLPPVRSSKNKKGKGKSGARVSFATPTPEEKPETPSTQNGLQTSGDEFTNYDLQKATEAYNKERQGKALSETISEEEKQKRLEEANYEKENGNANVKNQKWKEAIECYTRAAVQDDTNPIFFANRALCYIKLKRFSEAAEDCTKAIALDPTYVKAYLRRGSSYISLGEAEAAIEDLTKAAQMEPANKEARKCLADAKALQKKLDSTDNSTIVAISKSLNERSKAPLKRINIEEIGSKQNVKKKDVDVTENTQRPTSLEFKQPSSSTSSSRTNTPRSATPKTPITPLPSTPAYLTEIPEAPKNSVQFTLTWGQIKPDDRYKYLSQIPGSQLPQVFGDSLESGMLTDVLLALKTAKSEDPVAEYLIGLSETRRFMAIAMFMNTKDKSIVAELIKRSAELNHITKTEAANLEKKFGL